MRSLLLVVAACVVCLCAAAAERDYVAEARAVADKLKQTEEAQRDYMDVYAKCADLVQAAKQDDKLPAEKKAEIETAVQAIRDSIAAERKSKATTGDIHAPKPLPEIGIPDIVAVANDASLTTLAYEQKIKDLKRNIVSGSFVVEEVTRSMEIRGSLTCDEISVELSVTRAGEQVALATKKGAPFTFQGHVDTVSRVEILRWSKPPNKQHFERKVCRITIAYLQNRPLTNTESITIEIVRKAVLEQDALWNNRKLTAAQQQAGADEIERRWKDKAIAGSFVVAQVICPEGRPAIISGKSQDGRTLFNVHCRASAALQKINKGNSFTFHGILNRAALEKQADYSKSKKAAPDRLVLDIEQNE